MIISYTIIRTTYKGKALVHTRAYRVEVHPHSLTLAPDADEWSHHDLAFYPGKEFWSPLERTRGLAPEWLWR
jgi:hypothetical protein